MTVQEWFNKYNGKLLDDDGYYGGQCMDVYQRYTKEKLGLTEIRVPAAADVWDKHPEEYINIENNPLNIPLEGDVVIWGKNSGLSYGHIAICSMANVNEFTSFDQNWPIGSVCHFQKHGYAGVIGWLRYNPAIIAQPIAQEFTDQTEIPGKLLNSPGFPVDKDSEIQAIRGWLGDFGRAKMQIISLQTEIEVLDDKILQLQDEIEILKSREKTIGKELKDSLEAYNSLLRSYNALKSGDEADDNHLPQTIQLPPFISNFLRWLLKKLA